MDCTSDDALLHFFRADVLQNNPIVVVLEDAAAEDTAMRRVIDTLKRESGVARVAELNPE